MEGTLERKHRLQPGGKKAASRGWNSYHAVLYSHTMCFFQDRKDTLRSSACGLPLNLMGAECSPASDYTKKPNCFRLRFHDGSEYLFSTSSHFMMKKWVMRIQASTGQDGSLTTSSRADHGVPIRPSSGCFRCHDGAPMTLPSHKAKEIVVLSGAKSHLRSSDGHPPISSSDGGCYATYQRIKPTAHSPAGKGLEKGSNYSVTLVVGEKSGESSSVRSCEAPLPGSAGWQHHPEPFLRSFASLPRPSNKSVFRKFFGKKEL
ncbi:Spectrin beta chain, non-erythrocytic 1 [Oryzias melastigma]|uniref:Spectrin beta chain, non-erythrocytic 1 n=1 Tax=Oryzias melastigma TaxID=30732 RepID=A0A834C4N3_ORYME|nr:Spectrin beta chain, non-erythrocytic 1 [Oryzias melastigma]